MHLSDATLRHLAGRGVDTPRYDRGSLEPSIVHIGVGGFHRAHQAVYLDRLARSGDLGWGETGVGLRSRTMRAALGPQDCLYTVVERSSGHESARVVGVMRDYLFAPDHPRRVLDRIADPRTKLVTLTITGDGYNLDALGDFRDDEPAVRRDLRHPGSPRTWFGYVVAGLARRRAAGLGGFTVLSCDNLPNSGGAAEAAVVGFARLQDQTLARWIEHHVTFPDSMVDRITPRPDEVLAHEVRHRFGIHDRAPVVTETFTHWVIEDEFCQGRPRLEDVGVQFVSDVAPYKLMKTRLLNGTHTAMAYLGLLAGHRTTAEMVADPTMRCYLERLMLDEVAPLLPPVPGVDLGRYVRTVMERLANEQIEDQLTRLASRGSTKVPAYLLPSLIETRRDGQSAPLLTLAVGAWLRYAGPLEPAAALSDRSVMGPLAEDLAVRQGLKRALRDLERLGADGATQMRIGAKRRTRESRVLPLQRSLVEHTTGL